MDHLLKNCLFQLFLSIFVNFLVFNKVVVYDELHLLQLFLSLFGITQQLEQNLHFEKSQKKIFEESLENYWTEGFLRNSWKDPRTPPDIKAGVSHAIIAEILKKILLCFLNIFLLWLLQKYLQGLFLQDFFPVIHVGNSLQILCWGCFSNAAGVYSGILGGME